jgi:hypothetical protein
VYSCPFREQCPYRREEKATMTSGFADAELMNTRGGERSRNVKIAKHE